MEPPRIHPGPRGGAEAALEYRPPFLWDKLLDFFARRAIRGVEAVEDGRYRRTVQLRSPRGETLRGWFQAENRPERNALRVTVSGSLVPVLPQALSRVRRQFDLDCDPDAVYDGLLDMDRLRPGLRVRGTRLPGCFDPFEMAVRAVLGQQVTVKAANTLAGRLAETYGAPLDTGLPGLTRTFPTARDVLALGAEIEARFGALGVTSARSRTIRALAEALERGDLHLDVGADPEKEMETLRTIRGIGGWTAQYIAMRTLGWTDAFLDTDAGVKRALQSYSKAETARLSQSWSPWRSYATVNLWNSLS